MAEPLRTSPYAYAGGDPTNNTDPNGRSWTDVVDEVVKWGRGAGIVGGVCYAWYAVNDDDSSWSDEFADLNTCFNPYEWVTGALDQG